MIEQTYDSRKGIAVIWKQGNYVELKVGVIEFDTKAQEYLIRIPQKSFSEEPLSNFPLLATAINQDRTILLRLLKRIRAIQFRAKSSS